MAHDDPRSAGERRDVVVGILTFEIHLPQSGSLKGKRQVVRRLKDRLRARFNVAVAELEDHADLWQRAGLAVVSLAGRRDVLVRLFEEIERDCRAQVPGHVVQTATDYLQSAEAGSAGWGAEWE